MSSIDGAHDGTLTVRETITWLYLAHESKQSRDRLRRLLADKREVYGELDASDELMERTLAERFGDDLEKGEES